MRERTCRREERERWRKGEREGARSGREEGRRGGIVEGIGRGTERAYRGDRKKEKVNVKVKFNE